MGGWGGVIGLLLYICVVDAAALFCVCVCACGLFNTLEKWFPLQGERAHSLLLFVCTLIERRRRKGRQNNNYRAINLPKAV